MAASHERSAQSRPAQHRLADRRAACGARPFFLAVLDSDRGEFSVEGPMVDDRPWNHAVVLAQRAGRRVRCLVEADRNRIIADMKALYSWRLVRAGSIVRPDED